MRLTSQGDRIPTPQQRYALPYRGPTTHDALWPESPLSVLAKLRLFFLLVRDAEEGGKRAAGVN
jgi:hypothetical protein